MPGPKPFPLEKDLVPLAGLIAEKDLPVIASAINGRADVLVTGDRKDLLKLRRRRSDSSIASPAEFLDVLLPRLLKGLDPPGNKVLPLRITSPAPYRARGGAGRN